MADDDIDSTLSIDRREREAPDWEGFPERECGEHRTVGPHRAWCYDCHEWCYPATEQACKGCEIVALRAEIVRLRLVVKAVEEWRRYTEPGPIPAIEMFAMSFTAKHNLMHAIDEYLGVGSDG